MTYDDTKVKYVELVEESSTSTNLDAELVEEERKLVRKIDLWLLPTIWLMYLLSYMDVSVVPHYYHLCPKLSTHVANEHWQCQSGWHDR